MRFYIIRILHYWLLLLNIYIFFIFTCLFHELRHFLSERYNCPRVFLNNVNRHTKFLLPSDYNSTLNQTRSKDEIALCCDGNGLRASYALAIIISFLTVLHVLFTSESEYFFEFSSVAWYTNKEKCVYFKFFFLAEKTNSFSSRLFSSSWIIDKDNNNRWFF